MHQLVEVTLPNPQILEPIAHAVSSVATQAKIAHTLQTATIALAGQKPLLLLAQKILPQKTTAQHAISELIRRQESLEVWAKELRDSSNHDINLPALINIWVTLEALCENLCTAILLTDASSLANLRRINKKIDATTILTEESAREAYKLSILKVKDNGLTHGFLTVFAAIGFTPKLSTSCITGLRELNYLRNCSLHRAGVVDDRKEKEAPSFPFSIGDQIVVSDQLFTRLYDPVSEFLQSLIPSLIESGHLK